MCKSLGKYMGTSVCVCVCVCVCLLSWPGVVKRWERSSVPAFDINLLYPDTLIRGVYLLLMHETPPVLVRSWQKQDRKERTRELTDAVKAKTEPNQTKTKPSQTKTKPSKISTKHFSACFFTPPPGLKRGNGGNSGNNGNQAFEIVLVSTFSAVSVDSAF